MVYVRMEKLGLKRFNLRNKSPTSFVYATRRDFSNSKKLLILIHGRGEGRAGTWTRLLILYNSLYIGSQLPIIRRALLKKFDVLVMNTNDIKRFYRGQIIKIPGSSTPEQHAITVWDKFVANARNLGKVVLVARSYGGVVTLELARQRPDFFRIVSRVAFADSVHSFAKPAHNMALLENFRRVNISEYILYIYIYEYMHRIM